MKATRGNALVLVVVVLAALVAIATPFALSMRLQERTARGFLAQTRAEQAARAARELAVLRLLAGHPMAERRTAEAQAQLADSSEDWDDPQELAVQLGPLDGASRFELRDPKGAILAAEVQDEQGKANLNSASALLLGNLLGVAELARDVAADEAEIALLGEAPFYSDGDPLTYDGILRVGGELVVYRHVARTFQGTPPVEVDIVQGCERGAFFSAPTEREREHEAGHLVHDARGGKLALHPLWTEMGEYRPFVTLMGAREIANWQLVDYQLAILFTRGVTPDVLASYGLGGDAIRDAGGARALEGYGRRAAEAEARTATADADDDEPDAGAGADLAGRMGRRIERGTNAADVADAVLRRLGRRDGKEWLEKVLGQVAGASGGDAARFVREAQARVREIEEAERKYFRGASEQVGRMAEARDLEVLSAREIEGLRDLATVAGARPGEWVGGALVVNRIEFNPRGQATTLLLGVDIPEARDGAIARIDLPDGRSEYRRIAGYRRGAAREEPSRIVVFPQIEGDWAAETLRVSVQPAHPVNVNTAPVRLLEALFTGLAETGKTDFVGKAAAATVARRIAAGTLKDHGDLARVLDAAVAANEITTSMRMAILTNAIDPGSPGLRARTAPFCYRGAEVATIVATGIINDPAGNELARQTIREVVAVAPPREALLHWDSQADLHLGWGRGARLPGRRGNLVETFPEPLRGLDLYRVPPVPSRSHDAAQGEVRIETGEAAGNDAWEKPRGVRHFRREPEGSKDGPFTESTEPIRVANPLIREVLIPGHFEMWLRPRWATGSHILVDTGPDRDDRNRIALYATGTGELVLDVSDAALDEKESAYLGRGPRTAQVRAAIAFAPDAWVHVAAGWRGTKQGDLALFVDGLPVGVQKNCTRLSSDIGQGDAVIPVDDGSIFPIRGVVLVGTEALDYANTSAWLDGPLSGNRLAVRTVPLLDPQGNPVLDPRTGQPVMRRQPRAGQPRAHKKGTPVEIYGYTDFLAIIPPRRPGDLPAFTTLPAGGASLVARPSMPAALPAPTPKALTYPEQTRLGANGPLGVPAAATDIPILSGDGERLPRDGGVVQIGTERIRYTSTDPPGGVAPEWLKGCTRGYDGTQAQDHLALVNVILVDLPVAPSTQPFPAQGLVQLSTPSDPPAGVDPLPEWVQAKKPADGATNLLILDVDDTRNRGRLGEGASIFPPGTLPPRAAWKALAGTLYTDWVGREECRARAQSGTSGRAHAPGGLVLPTFVTQRRLHGRLDWVTITELDQSTRLERRVAWSSGNRLAFTEAVPRDYSALPGRSARLVKRPSGELPTWASPVFSIGARRPDALGGGAGGPIDARVDEPVLAEDSDNVREYVSGFLGARWGPAGNVLPRTGGADIDVPAGNGRAARAAGLLAKVDDEVVACAEPAGSLVRVTARGLLATAPEEHSDEARPYLLPFPAVVRLSGGLDGARGETIPTTGGRPGPGLAGGPGYLALDRENGGGIAEFLPYDRREGNRYHRPLDDRRRGAYRGSFGTEKTTPLRDGALAYLFPFRFHDRFDPAIESDDAVFWQGTVAPAGAAAGSACFFRAIEWDEELPPADVDAVVLARLDGSPPWDTPPTNAPGGIWRFDDPRAENRLDVAGRTLEVRVVFPFKPGAYGPAPAGGWKNGWKATPRLGALRVRYVEPIRVLSSEEVGS